MLLCVTLTINSDWGAGRLGHSRKCHIVRPQLPSWNILTCRLTWGSNALIFFWLKISVWLLSLLA
jgi:hypothetical protein